MVIYLVKIRKQKSPTQQIQVGVVFFGAETHWKESTLGGSSKLGSSEEAVQHNPILFQGMVQRSPWDY